MTRSRRMPARALSVLLCSALLVGCAAAPDVEQSFRAAAMERAISPFEHGSDPDARSLGLRSGPYTVERIEVPRAEAPAFGGGTLHLPEAPHEERFAVVVAAPGYGAGQQSLAWLTSRIASYGFAVLSIDTADRRDQPISRAAQIEAATDWLLASDKTADRIDPDRIGYLGHSMGARGALIAAEDRPGVRAVVALTPYGGGPALSASTTPTLVMGAEDDVLTPADAHAVPMFEMLGGSGPHAYLEVWAASHLSPTRSVSAYAVYPTAWFKRHLDDDERYEPFLCSVPQADDQLSATRLECTR